SDPFTSSRPGDLLNRNTTRRPAAACRNRVTSPVISARPRLHRPPPTTATQKPSLLYYLHKLLPSSFHGDAVLPVLNDEPHDPLDSN
ncbi:hypothetical protein AZE42_01718, partial [Rhizopogon vesiculosus]